MNRSTRRRQAREAARRERGARTARRGAALAAGATLALSGSSAWLASTARSAGATCSSGFNVYNNADSGSGSLRDGVSQVCEGGSIFFNGVSGQTISVSTAILLDKFVTLDGGANNVTITGGDFSRVFRLDPTKTGTGTVSINNLTIAHGIVVNSSGAGLQFACGSPTIDLALDHVTVTSMSTATGTTSNGTGVYVGSCGDVTVSNSHFSYSSTGDPGGPAGLAAGLGVRDSGDVTLTNVDFDHLYLGGALSVRNSGDVTLNNADFSHTDSISGPGAVALYAVGAVAITGTDALYTSANAGAGGFGFVSYVDSVAITDSTFHHNDAQGGGGAFYFNHVTGAVTITGSEFLYDTSLSGGAVYVDATVGSISIVDSVFGHNSAYYQGGYSWTGGGGAVMSRTDLTVTGSSFHHNTADGSGGAIAAHRVSTDVEVSTSTFYANSAALGGSIGLPVDWYGSPGVNTLVVRNSTFHGDTSTYRGGAISVDTDVTAVTIANATFTDETSASGGAMSTLSNGTLLIAQSTITGNAATGPGGGGGVYIYDDTSTQTISGTILTGNTSVDPGDDLDGASVSVTANGSLLGDVNGVTLSGGSATGVAVADVALGALADNGGPTKTMALGAGSVAIDAGPSPVASFTGNTTDQRGTGYDRVVNGTVDVGAFEVQAALPPPPTALNLTSLGGRSARLTWTAPASGPTPTGYQIRCLPVGSPVDVGPGGPVVYVGSATTTVDIPDLVGATTYVCHVRARYGAQYFSWLGDSDEGPLSDPSNSLLVAATVPATPGRVTASTPPQPSGQATNVGFVAPENRSGAPVTRYDARCTSSNGGTTRTGSGAASPVGVGNLTKGRTYSCVVSAVNSVGPSAWSAASARIVVPAGPVTNVRASTPTASGRRTTVSFTAPDGGPTPARYWVECRTADGSSVLTGTEVRSPVTVTNLVRGRTYTCRVWAVFEAGVRGPVSAASTSIRVP